ncbi:MAG TPA: DUF2254 family protein [Planctomycetota bacterium]|nr:DUF2254 family protein [Planctomycetota bacterium]
MDGQTSLRKAHPQRFSVGLVVLIFAALHVVFALFLYLDLRHGARHAPGLSLADFWNALDGSAGQARMAGTTISRAYNVLVSMVLTSIALAIPLTANMYTPKLIDIFIKDRVNIAVLAFFVFSSAQAIWSTQATWDQGPLRDYGGVYPRVSLWVAFETITLGWAILIPYFYYVFRFLNPTNIIERVSGLVTDTLQHIPRGEDKDAIAAAQRELEQRILHLGNVILRAVDRADRDVTLDAVRALKRVLILYQYEKDSLPDLWFRASADLFVGLSNEAIDVIRGERIWVEHKCLHQLALAYNASLAKMQDAISAISDVTREIVLNAESQADLGAVRLGIRFFNTFIREAVKRKDAHAIFDVLQQYKELAHDLFPSHPELVLEIVRHVKYYADFARLSGLTFIYELAAYDVESILEWAYQRDSATRRDVLEVLLSFDAVPASARLAKARAIAGGFFHERGLGTEEALVRQGLAPVPPAVVQQALSDILATKDPVFWEVTDRQVNIDFVDDTRKRAIERFLVGLIPTPLDGPARAEPGPPASSASARRYAAGG